MIDSKTAMVMATKVYTTLRVDGMLVWADTPRGRACLLTSKRLLIETPRALQLAMEQVARAYIKECP